MRNKLDFIKVLWSPFKPFKLKWYVGKIAVGTPYFYPRRWRKFTEAEAVEAATNDMNNPKLVKEPYETRLASYRRYTKPVPKKIGFDFVSLGWKTKYDSYRYEWAPRASFVFFGYQIAVIVSIPHADHYWEAWLYYENDTDKTKSKQERIAQCRKEAPQTWTTLGGEGKEDVVTDYYDLILRKKYL